MDDLALETFFIIKGLAALRAYVVHRGSMGDEMRS
jgi:hypothetical protein